MQFSRAHIAIAVGSASLIVLGLLFLGGGWLLERTRRRLISQVRQEAI